MFSGFDVIQVEPGTEIRNGDKTLTVTDSEAVTKGRSIYVTAKQFEALRAHTKEGQD